MILGKDWSTIRKLMVMQGAIGGMKAVEDFATGNPVVFQTDLSKPLKKLAINLLPVQEGSGDPSPSNIRPLLPWGEVGTWTGGKNLLNPNFDDWETRATTYRYINGVVPEGTTARFTLEVKDASVDISGCYIGFVAENLGETSPQNYRWVVENGAVQSDMSNLSKGSSQFRRLCRNVFVYPQSLETFQKLFGRFNIMVEIGDTATAFVPYTPIIPHPVDLTGITPPVYGCELVFTSEGVQVWGTYGVVDLGTLDYTVWQPDEHLIFNAEIQDKKQQRRIGDLYCPMYGYRVVGASWSQLLDGEITGNGVNHRVYFRNNAYATKEAFKEAMSGVPLVYELATPVLLAKLTPQQVSALVGVNTVWSDANGQIEVTFLKRR